MSRSGSGVRRGLAHALRCVLVAVVMAVMIPVGVPAAQAVGATYWVDIVNGADTNLGTEAEPFKTITYAVSVAGSADTIMVKPGIYSESNGETLQIVLSGETLISTQGAATTIIDGEGATMLLVVNGWGAGDRLEGFTFRNGGTGIFSAVMVSLPFAVAAETQPTIAGNVFSANNVGTGGALVVSSPDAGVATALTIQGNAFENNNANTGGAIRYDGYGSIDIVNNRFDLNTAGSGGAVALFTHEAASSIRQNTFVSNAASGGGDGGAVYWNGNGSALRQTIADNVFASNAATSDGGALFLINQTVDIARNRGAWNSAFASGSGGSGGFGFVGAGCTVAAENNSLHENYATYASAWHVFEGSTLDENSDTVACGAGAIPYALYADSGATVNITNSIYWNPSHTDSDIVGADSVTYTCVADASITGVGVIHGDPLFADPANHLSTIASTSPCIDAANTATAPTDDFYHSSRPKDGDGNGTAIPDMGCVEYENLNVAPVLDPIGAQSVDEGSPLTFIATATDDDGDALIFSLPSPPTGASITSAGVFTWTPVELQGPGVYTVDVNVSDGQGGTDTEAVRVTVAEVNVAPMLTPIGSKSVIVGQPLSFTATATDADLPANTLTYSLTSAPAGASIDPATGAFTWTPSAAGTFNVTVQVSDGTAADSETIAVTVAETELIVTPVEGAGRVETAIAASQLGFAPGSSEYVIIATARSFPDALGGSALAGVLDAPILLTEPTVLSDAVKAEIARLGASHVIVLGGTGAVSAPVYGALDALPSITEIERIFGDTRYETADKIAKRVIAEQGSAWDGTAFVATGESFPDALGGSPVAAAKGWPIYLVHPNVANHDALVAAMKADGVTDVLILGGTGVVPATLETKLDVAFGAAKVDRLFGANRYDTAVAVATYGVTTAGLTWDHVAVATGENFPDALSGGALQGKSGSVMVLAYPGYLHDSVQAALTANKATITEVRFLGGTGAVPQIIRDAVVQALQ